MRFRDFLHRDDKDSGGGGSKEKGGSAIADRLVARYGSPEAALARLAEENYEYREEKRTLTKQLEDAQKAIPKDGAVVLTGDDATTYTAFRALDLAPEKIREALTERDAVKATLAERDRAAEIHAMATAAGFKPSVLTDLAKTKGLHLELRDTQVQKADGTTETRKVPHVRYAAKTDAALEPLDAFATRELADYLPALAAKADAGTTGSSGSSSSGMAGGSQPLTPFQGQPASGGAPSGDVVGNTLAAQGYELPSQRDARMHRRPAA